MVKNNLLVSSRNCLDRQVTIAEKRAGCYLMWVQSFFNWINTDFEAEISRKQIDGFIAELSKNREDRQVMTPPGHRPGGTLTVSQATVPEIWA